LLIIIIILLFAAAATVAGGFQTSIFALELRSPTTDHHWPSSCLATKVVRMVWWQSLSEVQD